LDPDLLSRFERFSRNYLAEIRESITLSDLNFKLFLGPSNGPNGKPKLETAQAEASVLVEDKKLYSALEDMCIITNNNTFLNFVKRIASENCQVTDRILLRKLTSVPDKGNKSRVIAICDFITQSILAPLELVVVDVTQKLFHKQCAYYSHSRGWDDIQSQPEEVRQSLVSLDASSWTDNLPASLQHIVMKALFGQRLADAWYALAVKCPWFVQPKTRPIFYGKGQGMGTKGSFAIAQLTDLIFIKFSLGELYPDSDDAYFMKVGDDLILEDPLQKFCNRYEEIGVPINQTKSKFKTSFGTFTEFVSRNGWNGHDYSIISPGLISKFLRNDHYGPTLFNHLKERYPNNNPNFVEIFDMKKDVLSDQTKDHKALEDRTRTVMKLTTVLDLSEGTQLVEDPDKYWENDSFEVKLQFFENLILSTLGAQCHQAKLLLGDRDAKIARAKAQLLLTRYELYQDGDSFMEFVESNSMTLKDAAAAQEILSLARVSRDNYDAGVVTDTPERFIFLDESANCLEICPETIQFLLKLQVKLGEAVVGYKTIQRLHLFDKANTKAVLQLYRYLNSVAKLSGKSLDITTGQYAIPYKKEDTYEELGQDLILPLSKLFKFDVMLKQIDNIRQRDNYDCLNLTFQPQGVDEKFGSEESSKDQPRPR
jgi:hypothetical protein